MGDVITCFLEQLGGFKKFSVMKKKKVPHHLLNLKNNLENLSVTKFQLLFLNILIPAFNIINLLFQSEAPAMMHIFRSIIENFFTELLARFFKPSAFAFNTEVDDSSHFFNIIVNWRLAPFKFAKFVCRGMSVSLRYKMKSVTYMSHS